MQKIDLLGMLALGVVVAVSGLSYASAHDQFFFGCEEGVQPCALLKPHHTTPAFEIPFHVTGAPDGCLHQDGHSGQAFYRDRNNDNIHDHLSEGAAFCGRGQGTGQ